MQTNLQQPTEDEVMRVLVWLNYLWLRSQLLTKETPEFIEEIEQYMEYKQYSSMQEYREND